VGGIEISKSPKGTGYRLLSHQKPVEQLDLDAGQRLFLSFEASLFLSEWNYIDMYVHVHIQLYDPAHSILGEFSSLRATESCFWFWLSYFISRSNSEIAFFYPFLWSHETGLPLDVLVEILYGPAVFAFPEIGLKDFTNLSSGEHKLRFKVLENVFINMGYLNLAMANVIEMNILFMRGLEHKPTDLS